MTKKTIIATCFTVLLLSACSLKNSTATTQPSASSASTASSTTSAAATKDLPDGNYADLGDGTFYVTTAGGTSQNGNVPIVYASSDTSMMQIGYSCSKISGASLSYIYVDGMLNDKKQLGTSSGSINLKGDSLAIGTHKVEVVQYQNDDTTAKMTCYKVASYQVKHK